MIDILTNGLLSSPVPIQYTGNYCSHNCSYCFANINNPSRKLDISKLTSQLKNYQKRNDLPSHFLREGYPLLISNNIDPFSKSNQPFVNELIFTLKDMGVPVSLATRGGVGWQEIADNITPSVWYVSIPYQNDDLRQKYEPNAPTLNERYELIDYVIKKGHKVLLSINPFNPEFAPNPIEIIKKAQSLGVKSVIVNKLHLTPVQQSNMTAKQKEVIGEELLEQAKGKKFTAEWLSLAMDMFNYCQENELNLLGMDTGLKTNNFIEFKECYSKTLPTVFDFMNWCYDNKNEGDLIYFDDFYNFFAPLLPDIKADISKYIINKAVTGDKSFYTKMKFRNILHLYWEHPKLNIGLAKHYPSFSWLKEQTDKKLDFVYDSDHNKILYYNKDNFNPKENTI
ncbi:MAG: radical SAM protein [Chitinophagales bacterium]|jgi:DNA repair photolyase